MAAETGTQTQLVDLLRRLHEAPDAFDFFQALRRLECAYRDRPRLGRSMHPAEDPVRLTQPPSATFAPATLASFVAGAKGRPHRLGVNVLGLFGPNGPLPAHLTEYAREREFRHHDPTFARFADIFHHRLLSLFYRAWADSEPVVGEDRPEDDPFALYVGALFGLGLPSLRHGDVMPDPAKLYYAGHLACQARHPQGLRAILEGFFRLPVSIEEFIGSWLPLPGQALTRLGASEDTGVLGLNVVVGEKVWSVQHKFRVRFGPLRLADYRGLLPDGGLMPVLVAVIRNYIGDELDWDLQLVLKREEVPELNLGDDNARLGWTTWQVEGAALQDRGDLVLGMDSLAGSDG